jgi:hypothetical protein
MTVEPLAFGCDAVQHKLHFYLVIRSISGEKAPDFEGGTKNGLKPLKTLRRGTKITAAQ